MKSLQIKYERSRILFLTHVHDNLICDFKKSHNDFIFSGYRNLRGRGALNDFSLKYAPKFKTQPLRKHVFLTSQKISVRISHQEFFRGYPVFLPVIRNSVFINLLTI